MKNIKYAGVVLMLFAVYDAAVNKDYLNGGVLLALGVSLFFYEKKTENTTPQENSRWKGIIAKLAVVSAFIIFLVKIYIESGIG